MVAFRRDGTYVPFKLTAVIEPTNDMAKILNPLKGAICMRLFNQDWNCLFGPLPKDYKMSNYTVKCDYDPGASWWESDFGQRYHCVLKYDLEYVGESTLCLDGMPCPIDDLCEEYRLPIWGSGLEQIPDHEVDDDFLECGPVPARDSKSYCAPPELIERFYCRDSRSQRFVSEEKRLAELEKFLLYYYGGKRCEKIFPYDQEKIDQLDDSTAKEVWRFLGRRENKKTADFGMTDPIIQEVMDFYDKEFFSEQAKAEAFVEEDHDLDIEYCSRVIAAFENLECAHPKFIACYKKYMFNHYDSQQWRDIQTQKYIDFYFDGKTCFQEEEDSVPPLLHVSEDADFGMSRFPTPFEESTCDGATGLCTHQSAIVVEETEEEDDNYFPVIDNFLLEQLKQQARYTPGAFLGFCVRMLERSSEVQECADPLAVECYRDFIRDSHPSSMTRGIYTQRFLNARYNGKICGE